LLAGAHELVGERRHVVVVVEHDEAGRRRGLALEPGGDLEHALALSMSGVTSTISATQPASAKLAGGPRTRSRAATSS
jgi:hypothetical protein